MIPKRYTKTAYLRTSDRNGESELAPFLNILNEMHARQTSKKVKAAMHTRLDVYKRQGENGNRKHFNLFDLWEEQNER